MLLWIAHWAMSVPMGWAPLFGLWWFSMWDLCYILHAIVFWVAHWAMSLPMGWANTLWHVMCFYWSFVLHFACNVVVDCTFGHECAHVLGTTLWTVMVFLWSFVLHFACNGVVDCTLCHEFANGLGNIVLHIMYNGQSSCPWVVFGQKNKCAKKEHKFSTASQNKL